MTANVPLTRAQDSLPPVELRHRVLKPSTKKKVVRVDAQDFSCRAAQYNLAWTHSLMPFWEKLGIAKSKRDGLTTAAEGFRKSACVTPDAPKARAAVRSIKKASDALVVSYATQARIPNEEAYKVLSEAQATLMAQAFACGGQQGKVGDYLRGGNPGPINVVGQPLGSGMPTGFAIAPLARLGSCGGGGGGGGGGLPSEIDGSKFAACVGQTQRIDECSPTSGDNDENAQAQAQIDAEAAEDEKEREIDVERTDKSVIVSDKGTSVVIEEVATDTTGMWLAVAFEAFAVGSGFYGLTLLSPAAPPAGLVAAVMGVTVATIQLAQHISEAANTPPVEFRIRPSKLCPLQVGPEVAFWTNPQGDALRGSDAFSVCTCAAGAKGGLPAQCSSGGIEQTERALGCAWDPYAYSADGTMCAELATSQNPWVTRAEAQRGICGYKDCGPFGQASYSDDACGCAGGSGGGPTVVPPEFLWTDPFPFIQVSGAGR